MTDAAPTPVTWSVIRQAHLSKLVDGVSTPGVNVTVSMSTGETFDVFVPADTYGQGADAVRSVLQHAATLHGEVGGLGGQAG